MSANYQLGFYLQCVDGAWQSIMIFFMGFTEIYRITSAKAGSACPLGSYTNGFSVSP
jgi:hypothetical protein